MKSHHFFSWDGGRDGVGIAVPWTCPPYGAHGLVPKVQWQSVPCIMANGIVFWCSVQVWFLGKTVGGKGAGKKNLHVVCGALC